MARHPGVADLLRYLTPNPNLQGPQADIAEQFYALTVSLLNTLTADSPELTAGLRKLLEAKDCMVRASLPAGD